MQQDGEEGNDKALQQRHAIWRTGSRVTTHSPEKRRRCRDHCKARHACLRIPTSLCRRSSPRGSTSQQGTAWRKSDLSACSDTCVPVTEFYIHLGLSLHQGHFPGLPDRSHYSYKVTARFYLRPDNPLKCGGRFQKRLICILAATATFATHLFIRYAY